MSFPSSDGTSTRLDHGQRSRFATFDWPFWSLWSNIRLLCNLHTWNFVLITEPSMIICHRSFIIPPLHLERGGGYTVLPLSVRSSQDVHNIFLSNYLWQQSDFWSCSLQKGQSKVANLLCCTWRIWVICRQILGCGHPSRNSMAGITSWSMVTGCLLPKSDLIFICCWCLSLHRMGLLPYLTMDNAAGLRLSIDPSEAYDQISDCCHK
jgi:hypothetical protein